MDTDALTTATVENTTALEHLSHVVSLLVDELQDMRDDVVEVRNWRRGQSDS
jgi:hypothetical protein